MNYPYSEKSGFESPQSYMYTPYEGVGFLHTFFDFRGKVQNKLIQACALKEGQAEGEIGKFVSQADFQKIDSKGNQTVETYPMLCCILKDQLSEKKENSHLRNQLDNFIRKFEVSKKLHSRYSSDFKKLGNEIRHYGNYCILAAICGIVYRRTHHLKPLNCLLKVLDLLCSIPVEKLNSSEKKLMLFALELEREGLITLIDQKGVIL